MSLRTRLAIFLLLFSAVVFTNILALFYLAQSVSTSLDSIEDIRQRQLLTVQMDAHLRDSEAALYRYQIIGEAGFKTQFFEQLNKQANFLGKRRPFRSGNPLQLQPALVNSQQPEQLPGFFDDLLASYITFQVMTVADVSAGNQDAVCPFQESLEQEAVIQSAGTHEPDQSDIGRILHP